MISLRSSSSEDRNNCHAINNPCNSHAHSSIHDLISRSANYLILNVTLCRGRYVQLPSWDWTPRVYPLQWNLQNKGHIRTSHFVHCGGTCIAMGYQTFGLEGGSTIMHQLHKKVYGKPFVNIINHL